MTHFYAVANGTEIGVFNSWKDCKQSVLHYPNATFKKCSTQKEAEDYIRRNVDVRTITQPRADHNRRSFHTSYARLFPII